MLTYLLILILFIALLIIGTKTVARRKYKRKQMLIAEAYDRLVRKFKLAIEYADPLRYRYIGMDKKNRKLILINHCGGVRQEECICLYEVAESKIVHAKDEFNNIKAVWLELKNKHNNHVARFCFYHKDYDPLLELPSLSRKAIHWKTKVDIHKHRGHFNFETEYVL